MFKEGEGGGGGKEKGCQRRKEKKNRAKGLQQINKTC